MASQEASTIIGDPNDGDIVSWGKGVAPNFKKRLLSLLEPGMKRHDNLFDSGAEMVEQHEDGGIVSNLINSEDVDSSWPLWDTATRSNYVSKLLSCKPAFATTFGSKGALDLSWQISLIFISKSFSILISMFFSDTSRLSAGLKRLSRSSWTLVVMMMIIHLFQFHYCLIPY
jgi:hypothetical protein